MHAVQATLLARTQLTWNAPFLPLRPLQLAEPCLEAPQEELPLSLRQPPNSFCSARLRFTALTRAMAKPSSAPATPAPTIALMVEAEMPEPLWPLSMMATEAEPTGVLPLALLELFCVEALLAPSRESADAWLALALWMLVVLWCVRGRLPSCIRLAGSQCL